MQFNLSILRDIKFSAPEAEKKHDLSRDRVRKKPRSQTYKCKRKKRQKIHLLMKTEQVKKHFG